jgi:hypothetical protein
MAAPAPVQAVSLAIAAGIPSALVPAVAERCTRTVAAVSHMSAGRSRLTQQQIAERVVAEAVRDWREGVLERLCAGEGL